MLSALNLDLRDEYVADCANGVRRWNQALEDAGLEERLILPHEGFNRRVGAYASHHVSPEGEVLDDATWADASATAGCPYDRGPPGRRRPDGAGVRVRQVRRLDRAAQDRHQRPAGRVRLRAPRRGGRGLTCRRTPRRPDLGPRGAARLGRRQAARHRRRARGRLRAAVRRRRRAARRLVVGATPDGDGRRLRPARHRPGAATPRSCWPSTPRAQEAGVGTLRARAARGRGRVARASTTSTTRSAQHPQRDLVHDWLVVRGFRGHRRRRPAQAGRQHDARRPSRRTPAAGGVVRRGERPGRAGARATRSRAATSTSRTTGTDCRIVPAIRHLEPVLRGAE